jgi:hypothetical protein
MTLMFAPANVSTHPRGRPDPPNDAHVCASKCEHALLAFLRAGDHAHVSASKLSTHPRGRPDPPNDRQETTLMLAPANVSTPPRGRPDPPNDRLPMVFGGPRAPQKTFGRPLSETLK